MHFNINTGRFYLSVLCDLVNAGIQWTKKITLHHWTKKCLHVCFQNSVQAKFWTYL